MQWQGVKAAGGESKNGASGTRRAVVTQGLSLRAVAGIVSSQAESLSIDVLICSFQMKKKILERTIVGVLGMD
jgi:hypothetical protein